MTISFAQLGLSEPILKTLEELGHTEPTPIQMMAIPAILSGRDLLGQAQTGTGKTGAFALPLLHKIDVSSRVPQVLVLTPTRELAIQVAEAFKTYARGTAGFRVVAVYGGQPMPPQLKELKAGAQVIVGTPGRVLDHIGRKSLNISNITALVLDEADEMLKMGFKDDLETILIETPAEKQVALFSATMPKEIRRVASTHLKDAEEIIIKSKTATVEAIQQYYCTIPSSEKLDALARFLEVREIEAGIIFVSTKASTLEVADALEKLGHSVAALNGDLTQTLRENTINRLKRGQIKLVVATDVAARGLHVDKIDHIINYDIPRDAASYVHRIGRTGRAGRTGTAILFVTPREERYLSTIERTTRQPIERLPLPDDKAVIARRIEILKKRVYRVFSDAKDLTVYDKAVQELSDESKQPMEKIAAALCLLVQREAPLQLQRSAKKPASESANSSFRGDRGAGRDYSERSRSDSSRSDRGRSEWATDQSDRARPDRARPERDRSDRDRPGRYRDSQGGTTFRIKFGREHGLEVGQIVSGICNATGLTNRQLGNIKLHDEYTTVELPSDLPRSAFAAIDALDFGTGLGDLIHDRGGSNKGRAPKKDRHRDRPEGKSSLGKERTISFPEFSGRSGKKVSAGKSGAGKSSEGSKGPARAGGRPADNRKDKGSGAPRGKGSKRK